MLQQLTGFEQQFFKLAAVWLSCRIENIAATTDKERIWHFLGEMDFHSEMALLCQEEKRVHNLSR